MNTAAAAVVGLVLALLLGSGVGLWAGHGWGKSKRADEVVELTRQLATVTGERDAAHRIANNNAANVTSLREMLRQARERAASMQRIAEQELEARAERIAALEAAGQRRHTTIFQKATNDEECAPLRDLPVCAAVADRLWGDAAPAGSH